LSEEWCAWRTLHFRRRFASHQPRKTHERQRQQAGDDETNWRAGECSRGLRQRQALAQAGEQQQHQREAERRTKAVQQAVHEIEFLLHIQQRHTQHSAVGGDQRQVDAEHLIQARAGLADDHFGELHGTGDDQNERQDAQVFDAQRLQHPVFQHPGRRRREGQHKGGGHAHAQCAVHLLRHTHERAEAEEFDQDHVVDQGSSDQQ